MENGESMIEPLKICFSLSGNTAFHNESAYQDNGLPVLIFDWLFESINLRLRFISNLRFKFGNLQFKGNSIVKESTKDKNFFTFFSNIAPPIVTHTIAFSPSSCPQSIAYNSFETTFLLSNCYMPVCL